MKFTVHAGHAAKGHLFTGAVGYCEESVVDRYIKDSVIKWLKVDGNLVTDCTVDKGLSQSNIISQIKKKINAEQNVMVNTSIHLNANKKVKADGRTKGVEVYVYSTNSNDAIIANSVVKAISRLGFKNRGVKSRTNLGILKGIKNKGANILIECFFCDDQDDYNLYVKLGPDTIGKAIAEGLVGHSIQQPQKATGKFVYGNVDLSPVFNPVYYAVNQPDVAKVYGTGNDSKLFEHFCIYGMKEARQACADFNPKIYRERYTDLNRAFSDDWIQYYKHYCTHGIKEGRKGI